MQVRRSRRLHFIALSLLVHLQLALLVLLWPKRPPLSESAENTVIPVDVVTPKAKKPDKPDRKKKAKVKKRPKKTKLLAKKKRPKKKQPPKEKQPPKKKQAKTLEKPQPPKPASKKMVELSTPQSKKPPLEARYLSDKDRRVKKETRARHTNLLRDHPKPRPTPTRAKQHKRQGVEKPRHSRAARKPRKAQTKRKARAAKRKQVLSPLLRMRTPERKTTSAAKDGRLQLPRKARPARPRPRLTLSRVDIDRILGKKAIEERERARLSLPLDKGGRKNKLAQKWKRIQAALQNFIPEVQVGNQTALGTRANPFAVYIARMHRRIHPLWGWGFLSDLELKSEKNPLNDRSLKVTMEIVVNPNGTIAKATIIRPSGRLEYDVAALNVVFTAGPYGTTPRKIRSRNGKVYIHWSFYRNHRQCGTFNAHPYVLTTPPKGPIDVNGGASGNAPALRRHVRRLNRSHHQHGHAHGHAHAIRESGRKESPWKREASAAARKRRIRQAKAAARKLVSSADPAAWRAARQFAAAIQRKDSKAMAAACRVPFSSQGKLVARSRKKLARLFESLLTEAKGSLKALEIMTLMEARQKMRSLPRNARYGRQMLVGRANLGKRPVRFLLRRRSGKWKVISLDVD
jgi:TonB family protein